MSDLKKLTRAIRKSKPTKTDQNIKANLDISELLGKNDGLDKLNYLLALKYLKVRRNILKAIIKKTQGGKLTGLKIGKDIKISELLGEPPKLSLLSGLRWLKVKNQVLKKVGVAAKNANFEFGKEIDINDILGSSPEQDFITKTRFFLIRQKLLSKISKAAKSFDADSMLNGMLGIESKPADIGNVEGSGISSAEGLSTDESLNELRGIHSGINNIYDYLLDDKGSKLKDREEKREQIARNERRHNEMLDATKAGGGGFGSGSGDGFPGGGEGGGGGGFLRNFLEFKVADKFLKGRRFGMGRGGLLRTGGARAVSLGARALPALGGALSTAGSGLAAAAMSPVGMGVGALAGGYAIGTAANHIPKLLGSDQRFSDMIAGGVANAGGFGSEEAERLSQPVTDEDVENFKIEMAQKRKERVDAVIEIRKEIKKHQDMIDKGDTKYGFSNLFSRKNKIADLTEEARREYGGLESYERYNDDGVDQSESPSLPTETITGKKPKTLDVSDEARNIFSRIGDESSSAAAGLAAGEDIDPEIKKNIIRGLARTKSSQSINGARKKLNLRLQAVKAGKMTEEELADYIKRALVLNARKEGEVGKEDLTGVESLYKEERIAGMKLESVPTETVAGKKPESLDSAFAYAESAEGLMDPTGAANRVAAAADRKTESASNSSPTETATGQKAESASNSSPTETATGQKTEVKSGYGVIDGQFTYVIDGMPYQYGEEVHEKTQNGRVVTDAFCYIKKGANNLDDKPENHRVDKESYAKFVEKMGSTDWLSSPELSVEEIRNLKSAPAPKQVVPKELSISVPNIGTPDSDVDSSKVIPVDDPAGMASSKSSMKRYTAYDKRVDGANFNLALFEKYNDSDYEFGEVDGIGYRRKYNDVEKQIEYEDLLMRQKRFMRRRDYQPVGGVDERSAEYYKQEIQKIVNSGTMEQNHQSGLSSEAEDLKFRYLEAMGYGTRKDYDPDQVQHSDLWTQMFLNENNLVPETGNFDRDEIMLKYLMKGSASTKSLDSMASIPSSDGAKLAMAQKENAQLKSESGNGGAAIVAPTNVNNSSSNVTNTTIAAPAHIDRTQNNFGATSLAY